MRFSPGHSDTRGFTLVEILIIAPIVILVIGAFVGLLISITGDVLVTRDNSAMAFETQDALDRIEQDTRLTTQFLTTTGGLTTPQGSNNNFTGADAFTSGSTLILGSLTTDKNPADTTRKLVYYAKQPNDCGAQETYNRLFQAKVIYFVKKSNPTDTTGSLWRRTVLPEYNLNASPNDNTVCAAPWQQNSCSPGYSTSPPCQTNDVEVAKNVKAFSVKYLSSPASAVDLGAAQAEVANAIEIQIDTERTTAGRTLSFSGTIRSTKLNNIDVEIPPPPAPTVTAEVKNNTATFSWTPVPTSTSYEISYTVNGGSPTTGSTDPQITTFSVNAGRSDTIIFNVAAKNPTGTSPNGTTSATIPAWYPCPLQGSWANYQNGYAPASYALSNNDIVHLKGLIRIPGTPAPVTQGTVVCVLPEGYRPSARLIFLTSTSGGSEGAPARIDVLPNGEIQLLYGATTGWVSLDMIRFVRGGAPYAVNNLSLFGGWQNYGASGYSDMQSQVDAVGRVHLQGLLKNGSSTEGTVAAHTPAAQRPAQATHFVAASTTAFNRFSVTNGTTEGRVIARGINGSGYWSIQGSYYPIAFSTGWETLNLGAGWVAYDPSQHSRPNYRKAEDGIVTVRGLIRSGTITPGTILANLPEGYRPAERLIFTTNANGLWSRVDVLANGDIVLRYAHSNVFLSLDPITFMAG